MEDDINLYDQIERLGSHWRLLLIGVAIGLGVALLAYRAETPTYQAAGLIQVDSAYSTVEVVSTLAERQGGWVEAAIQGKNLVVLKAGDAPTAAKAEERYTLARETLEADLQAALPPYQLLWDETISEYQIVVRLLDRELTEEPLALQPVAQVVGLKRAVDLIERAYRYGWRKEHQAEAIQQVGSVEISRAPGKGLILIAFGAIFAFIVWPVAVLMVDGWQRHAAGSRRRQETDQPQTSQQSPQEQQEAQTAP